MDVVFPEEGDQGLNLVLSHAKGQGLVSDKELRNCDAHVSFCPFNLQEFVQFLKNLALDVFVALAENRKELKAQFANSDQTQLTLVLEGEEKRSWRRGELNKKEERGRKKKKRNGIVPPTMCQLAFAKFP